MFSLLEMRVQFILCHSSTQRCTQQGLHSYLMDGWMDDIQLVPGDWEKAFLCIWLCPLCLRVRPGHASLERLPNVEI